MKARHRNGRKFRRPRTYALYYWDGTDSIYDQLRRPVTDADASKLMTGSIGRYEGFSFVEGVMR